MKLNYQHSYNQEIRGWLQKVFEFAARLPQSCMEQKICPVCGGDQHTHFANNDYLDYVRCKVCGLIYMNPAPSREVVNQGFVGEDKLLELYFDIITRYAAVPQHAPNPGQDDKLKDIYKYKKSGRLLDVGCSIGGFLHKAKYFYEVEGLEVNHRTAEVAARDFTVHRGMLEELQLDKRFDIVTLHQILYGVPDPVSLLREIHKILTNDGILYVNTPNADSYAMGLYGGKACHLYGYTTLNVFNKQSLQMLAKLTGFEIVSWRSEWFDIYIADMQEFFDRPDRFIHKRNSHLDRYEERIKAEEEFHTAQGLDLGEKGNYMVAVLRKCH